MRELLTSKAKLVFHDSPRTLPEYRRCEHNCYALTESVLGSDMDEADAHFLPLFTYLDLEDLESLRTGLNNLRYLIYNSYSKQYSFRSLAFACLLHTIDGQTWDDYTPEGVERLSIRLGELGVTDELINEQWGPMRKKIERELRDEFPTQFADSEADAILLQQRSLLLDLDEILQPETMGLIERRQAIEQEIAERIKPIDLNGADDPLARIRQSYTDAENGLALEGIAIDEKTPSRTVLSRLAAWFKRNKKT